LDGGGWLLSVLDVERELTDTRQIPRTGAQQFIQLVLFLRDLLPDLLSSIVPLLHNLAQLEDLRVAQGQSLLELVEGLDEAAGRSWASNRRHRRFADREGGLT
jgi:hypothetical protein